MALKFAVNNSLSAITTLPSSISGGALNLISTQTASASATIDFTSGIDSTYDSYVFKFINCHPATDDVKFTFQLSTDSGSNYNVTMTTTTFNSIHAESGAESGLSYQSGLDQAQGTSFQNLTNRLGGDNDQSASGYLHLFNPSSTTFVKHFISTLNIAHFQDYSSNDFTAGYGNTTSAVNAIRFQMSSGNIDDGIIKMYGVS
jgi:hypothetical protein